MLEADVELWVIIDLDIDCKHVRYLYLNIVGEVSAWKVHMIPADQINMQCVDKPNFVRWFITPWIL